MDLTGRAEFCFGSQRVGAGAADFALRLLSLRQHSLLHVHAGAGVTLSYAGVQARTLPGCFAHSILMHNTSMHGPDNAPAGKDSLCVALTTGAARVLQTTVLSHLSNATPTMS